jgi:hypothetical protein
MYVNTYICQTKIKDMRTYKSIRTSKLTLGMTFYMHGSDFKVTSSVKELPHRPGTFVCNCEIIERLPKGDYMELLNDYKTIQGNDIATWCTVVN